MKLPDPRGTASPKPKRQIGWIWSWLYAALLGAGVFVDIHIFGANFVDLFRHWMLLYGFVIACLIAWCGIRTLVGEWRQRSS
jgi:hypothetical protein